MATMSDAARLAYIDELRDELAQVCAGEDPKPRKPKNVE